MSCVMRLQDADALFRFHLTLSGTSITTPAYAGSTELITDIHSCTDAKLLSLPSRPSESANLDLQKASRP